MTFRLSPDELGAAGEALFASLCSRAPFVCNKSDRDRTGWDYVVEPPMPPAGGALSLDQRTPTAFVVQVKSTGASGPVSARLSAIDRLAKDPRPAFVVVFRLKPNGDPIAGYLIHLIGPALARVLRRLRNEEARGTHDINHASISFDHHKLGRKFRPTPEGLKSAVLEACGPDPAAYLREKRRQLDELGYEDGVLQAEAIFRVESADHLTNVLMGLEPLKPTRLAAYDTRFGIRIPYTGPAFDELEELVLEPPSLGTCQVLVRGPALAPPAVFDAEMLVAPPLGIEDGVWLVVRHDAFTLTFRESGAAFGTTRDFDTKPRLLSAWRPIVRALRYLADGQGVITLVPANHPAWRLDLPSQDKLTGPYIRSLPRVGDFLEGWTRLLDMAGVIPDTPFLFDTLTEARDAHIAVDVMIEGGAQTRFAFDADVLGDPKGPIEALYFNTCRLGDTAVSFAAKVTLARSEATPLEFVSTGFAAVDARPFILGDLQDYGEEVAGAHGISVLIHPDNITEVAAEMIGR